MATIVDAREQLNKVIFGKDDVIELLFIAILTGGHVLLESVPGTGKTKLAKSFAKVIDGEFSRVQFTPDVLPSDVTGIRFFNPKTQAFELHIGPVATTIMLADEINRATPRTQSSLLEVMEEHQTTIDGETITIPEPFLVIATQNPVESNHGTFPLPEAQLDRFLFKIDLGYPSLEEERNILQTYRQYDPFEQLKSILTLDEIKFYQKQIKEIAVSDVVTDYILNLINQSRLHTEIALGISPRGALAVMKAAQARAFVHGRHYVTPQDIQTLVPFIFEHRLVLTMEGTMKKTKSQVVQEVIQTVNVPVEIDTPSS